MTEPSPELVEEIKRTIWSEWNALQLGHGGQGTPSRSYDERNHYEIEMCEVFARAVLSSPSIARQIEALKSAPRVPIGLLKNDADLHARVSGWFNLYADWLFGPWAESTPQASGLSAIAQERDGWMPIASAPKDGTTIVILTKRDAHRADWDRSYDNFWSLTGGRALSEEEIVGWMSSASWESFASTPIERSEIGEAPVERAVNTKEPPAVHK